MEKIVELTMRKTYKELYSSEYYHTDACLSIKNIIKRGRRKEKLTSGQRSVQCGVKQTTFLEGYNNL